jgi:hypothetical protein
MVIENRNMVADFVCRGESTRNKSSIVYFGVGISSVTIKSNYNTISPDQLFTLFLPDFFIK